MRLKTIGIKPSRNTKLPQRWCQTILHHAIGRQAVRGDSKDLPMRKYYLNRYEKLPKIRARRPWLQEMRVTPSDTLWNGREDVVARQSVSVMPIWNRRETYWQVRVIY